jgi:hypothetical protein
MKGGTGGCSRRKFVAGSAGLLAGARSVLSQQSLLRGRKFCRRPDPGPFRPNWESLRAYRLPDWFRDANFGIWAHWSPQCVPEQGDRYARDMYIQGSSQYDYHVKTYGHPSQFGYKDICHIWPRTGIPRTWFDSTPRPGQNISSHWPIIMETSIAGTPNTSLGIASKSDRERISSALGKELPAHRGSGSELPFKAHPAGCGSRSCRSATAAMPRVP